MDNSKRNVHNSGPLGKLMQAGQIKKIEIEEEAPTTNLKHVGMEGLKSTDTYFKTQSGIKFRENELLFIDPNECEPWEYANRSIEEMGDLDELMLSIKSSSQLQPALIRLHPSPHENIKYQVIFGRRRLEACKRLNIQLLAIIKDKLDTQEAIACQDAENKLRADVSNYSNALLYKRLINDKAFASGQELANKLNISKSSFAELMTYTKIPSALIIKIPDIHNLPVYMAIKLVKLITEDSNNLPKLIAVSSQIGLTLNTPAKLEAAIKSSTGGKSQVLHGTRIICDDNGKKLFTFKIDHKGLPSISFNKGFSDSNIDFFVKKVKDLLLEMSGVRTSEPA